MVDFSVWKVIVDYGVAVVGLIFVTAFMRWLIKYILERNKQREDMYMELMKNDLKHFAEVMNNLTTNINNFSSNVNEAHRFQRDEHKQMIETLIRLNGDVKEKIR